MIQKVVTKRTLKDVSAEREDLAYWLTKTPQERVATVDYLRRQQHGSSVRLQRFARIIKQTVTTQPSKRLYVGEIRLYAPYVVAR